MLFTKLCEEWLIQRLLYLNGHFLDCSARVPNSKFYVLRGRYKLVRGVVRMMRKEFAWNLSTFVIRLVFGLYGYLDRSVRKFIRKIVYGWYVKAYICKVPYGKCIRKVWPINGMHIVPLDMKRCICHLVKWQIHPFISKGGGAI